VLAAVEGFFATRSAEGASEQTEDGAAAFPEAALICD
jgi:hypothetical protein